jgi:crotonobetainyl-CoA:carnitine CoA-transferase CaiB-like acyl-CoA transferase
MQPMQGIRIIDVTTNASGPMATGILGDQGADVIRFETVGAGDPARHVGGVRGGLSAYFAQMNRNKRSMAVDLKNPSLRPALYKLIESADVFVQNSRPGALDRAGYGYEDLHRINPNLIYVSISGFGASGPAAAQRVYDPVIQSVSGFAAAQGVGGEPTLMKTIASDKVAALTASQAIAAALFARARGTIGGHHVELSMLDASLAFLWADIFWNDSFVGSEGFSPRPLIASFYELFPTIDGHVTLIIVGDGEFAGVCSVLGLEHLLEDPRFTSLTLRFANYSQMLGEIKAATKRFNSADLIARLEQADVPCAKVNRLEEVGDDPRVQHGQSLVEYTHPRGGRIRQARAAAVFDGERLGVRHHAPALGEHTEELLLSVGCSKDEIAAWREAGTIGG